MFINTANLINNMKKDIERPLIVSMFCILSLVGLPLYTILIINGIPPVNISFTKIAVPFWYTIFSIILNLLYFICLIYIWKMKKMGVFWYNVILIFDYFIGSLLGFSDLYAMMLSGFKLGIIYTQLNKMKY